MKKFLSVKKTILTISMIFVVLLNVNATNYYVSATGSDSNNGRSESSPWKTIAEVNDNMNLFQPGDTILFKRGETFYGGLNITKSGTETSPIVFDAYGTGPKPIISGLMQLTNWVDKDNGIWEADCPDCDTMVNIVLMNGQQQAMGHYPNIDGSNKGYLKFESHNLNQKEITDNELSDSDNWTGGEVVIRKYHWSITRNRITSHFGRVIKFEPLSTVYGFGLTDNYGYFIQNHIKTLDQFGEWYYNNLTKKIYFYFGQSLPNNSTIEAGTIKKLVDVEGDNIVLTNLKFKGANEYAINKNYNGTVFIRNSIIDFSGINAINGNANFKIENDSILHSNSYAVKIETSGDSYVKNCFIKNTDLIKGASSNEDIISAIWIITRNSGQFTAEYNTIDSTGLDPIVFFGSNIVIKKNYLSNFCLNKDDGGGIYTNGRPGLTQDNRIIKDNIILNGIGAPHGTPHSEYGGSTGIYMDALTETVQILNNTVANCSSSGINLHNASKIDVRQNLLFNNKFSQLNLGHDFAGGLHMGTQMNNNKVYENILVSKLPNQMVLRRGTDANILAEMGDFDRNYYIRPFDDNLTIYHAYNRYYAQQKTDNGLNLQSLQQVLPMDLNSYSSPVKYQYYTINSLGANKITYGKFDSNSDITNRIGCASNVACGCSNFYKWDNTNKLGQGGSLYVKVEYPSNLPNNTNIYSGVGPIQSNKNYILKFKSIASKENITLKINLSGTQYDDRSVIIGQSVSQHEFLFTSVPESAWSNLIFAIDQTDGEIWIDDLEFYEANVTIQNPDDYIRFEYNSTQTAKTINLDYNYLDVYGTSYTPGSTTQIQPFKSIILLRKNCIAPSAPTVGTRIHPTCTALGSVVLNNLPSGNWTIKYGTNTINSSGSSYIVTGLSGNTYNFTITNAAGCTSVPSVNVVIDPQPATPSPPTISSITHALFSSGTGSVVLDSLPSGIWTLQKNGVVIIANSSGLTTTVAGLAVGTYTFTVTNSAGCTSASVPVTINPPSTYCSVSGTNFNYLYIAGVTVNGIIKTSLGASYSDFTSTVFNATAGSTTNISLNPGTTLVPTHPVNWKVWIDYNGDKDFDDVGENVFTSSGATNLTPRPFSITIPTNNVISTRMRIAMSYGGTSNSGAVPSICGTVPNGEYEDYTINISQPPLPVVPTALTINSITTTSAVADWTDTPGATSYTLQYRTGTGSWTTVTTTLSNYSITGLSANTAYEVHVRANNASGSSTYSESVTFTTINSIIYCPAQGNNSNYMWIEGITLNGTTKTSGAAGYSDFTSVVFNAVAGTNASFTIDPGSNYLYNVEWKIWIDFNKDGDFTDIGETKVSEVSSSTTTISRIITIPSGVTGSTRMRVRMRYLGVTIDQATPCGNFAYGEVEDYTINIKPAPAFVTNNDSEAELQTLIAEEQDLENDKVELKLFPSPAYDVINYTFNLQDEKIQSVVLMDMLGKLVEIDNAKAIDQRQINLNNNISSGIYYLRLTTDKGQYTKKFSVMK